MQLLVLVESQPVQSLSVVTRYNRGALKCFGQNHVGSQFGQQGHVEFFAQATLRLPVDVGHVAHDDVRRPV
jgi:hypothetical protein